MRILIIEDNQGIAETIGDFLGGCGHVCDFALDGVTGLHLAVTQSYEVIILDVMLPGIDGLNLAQRLRKDAESSCPILMLTARDTLQDKLAGFAAGCDDYLLKPFALEELKVRVEALQRRGGGSMTTKVLSVDNLRFDTRSLEIFRGERRVELKPMGRRLLQLLLEAQGAVCSREQLEAAIWGDDVPDGDALRVHVHAVRRAIDGPQDAPLLHTVRGAGYRLGLSR